MFITNLWCISVNYYDEIIKKNPNKGFISCIDIYLDIGIDNYKNWVCDAIKKDEEFKNSIKCEKNTLKRKKYIKICIIAFINVKKYNIIILREGDNILC